MSIIAEMFEFSFMIRAVVAGVIIALCAALLGVPLVLRRFSMIGDGLSHVGFGALAIGSALGFAPLYIAIPVVIIAAFALLRLRSFEWADAAVAMISAFALAVGMIAMSLRTGSTAGVNAYMFGSILAVSKTDMYLCVVLGIFVLLSVFILNKRMFAISFDEDFSRACGVNVELQNSISAVFTALTVVLGMRLMGSLLISSLVIFPGLAAMRVCKSYKEVLLVAAIIAVVCFFIGIVCSYVLSVPAGATVVFVDAIAYAVCFVVGKVRKT